MIRAAFRTVNFPLPSPKYMVSSSKNSHKLTVSFEFEGERLDVFLAHSMDFEAILKKKLSRSQIIRGIKEGGASIRNLHTNPSLKPSHVLSKNSVLEIFPEKFETGEEELLPEPNLPLTVIEENGNFLVIDKPAGIQVHPSATQKNGTVANWIIARYPEIRRVGDRARPGIIHRLDKDTSGLLLIARNKRSFTALKKLFKDRKIRKRYRALVFGVPTEKEGVIETPIARSTRGDRQTVAPQGKRVKGVIRHAETRYHVIETLKNSALIEAEPKTGRTHQIRVHLASIGHPVLGDRLYASKTSRELSGNLPYHLLHATSLAFTLFGRDCAFTSPIPKDFEKYVTLYKFAKVS